MEENWTKCFGYAEDKEKDPSGTNVSSEGLFLQSDKVDEVLCLIL